MKTYVMYECSSDFYALPIGVFTTLEKAQECMMRRFEEAKSNLEERDACIESYEVDAMEATLLFRLDERKSALIFSVDELILDSPAPHPTLY